MMADSVGAASVEQLDPPLRMDGVTYRQVALRRPFAADAPIADEWRLYVVRGDGAILRTPDASHIDGPLADGTVLGMSGEVAHTFASGPPGDGAPDGDWTEMALGNDTGGADVVIIVGRIPQSSMPFLSLLGGFIRIDPSVHSAPAARIGRLVDWIADETIRGDPTAATVVQRLAEVITIEIGRIGRTESVLFSERSGTADYDPRIWRAIAAVSTNLQQRWTVDAMAEIAGMSRSAFAARYRATTGMTPLKSLRRLRMHRAVTSLTGPGLSRLAPLAGAIGYGSDAAFCRAFTREFGHPPKHRKQPT